MSSGHRMQTFTFEATGWARLPMINIQIPLVKGAYFVKTFRQKNHTDYSKINILTFH